MMPFRVDSFVEEEAKTIIRARGKALAPQLLDALKDAFRIGDLQEVIDAGPSPGFRPERQDKIHRKQIGTLVRGLTQAVASSAKDVSQIGAKEFRTGYAQWKQTRAFRRIARRYHGIADAGQRLADQDKAVEQI